MSKFIFTIFVDYTGRHSVAVVLDGEPVKGSPFACNIYDVSKVKISGLVPSKVMKIQINL